MTFGPSARGRTPKHGTATINQSDAAAQRGTVTGLVVGATLLQLGATRTQPLSFPNR